MLANVSYNNKAQRESIDTLVGKPFTLMNRLKLGGVGSPKLHVVSSSKEIDSLLILDHNDNTCNIELRPKGIILRFRSLLETYALVIPYYKLTLYKGKAQEYSIYIDKQFVKVVADTKASFKFFSKISAEKAANQLPGIEDL